MTNNVSALFINDLVAATGLSVFHKTELSLVLVQYAYNKSHMYTTISNIRALKYLELLLRLGCASMLRMNFISLPVTNSADGGRRSYPKLSKCNKTAGFRPIPRWGERLLPFVSQPPPVGECCPLIGVPPSATTDFLTFITISLS